MWDKNWRETTWANLNQHWDIIIIGGGITGAGILRQATASGLKVLLVEQRDFAWGTSSRSSKMVHGGLRYLKEGNIALVREAVYEREQLLKLGPGLVEPLSFLMPHYKGEKPSRTVYNAGLTFYDWLAKGRQRRHRYFKADQFEALAPRILPENLEGGFQFWDAQTDDARLVLRIIREAVADGGTALNYVKATELLFNEAGTVRGVRLQDCERPRTVEATARIVINATGAWADRLRQQVGAANRLRPLRGSHLVFPRWRLPVAQVVNLMHPLDHRPVFLYPWEGVTIVGTTDLDHSENLDLEPVISPQEASYLMAAAHALFPSLNLTLDDVIATWAGVRPVIKTDRADPSKEPRDHVIWPEKGLLTVTGGKLTTFRVIARDALKAVREYAPDLAITDTHRPVLNQVSLPRPASLPLDEAHWRRLLGHYSAQAAELVGAAQAGELEPIPGTPYLWAELRWAARAEGVVHLDDLLLRRLRLGLLLPQGGQSLLPRIRSICQMELGWDDARWEAEVAAYLSLWHKHYSLPDKSTVLDWRATPNPTQNRPEHRKPARTRWLIAILLSAAGLLLWRWRTKKTA